MNNLIKMSKKLISIFALFMTIALISACTWTTKDIEHEDETEKIEGKIEETEETEENEETEDSDIVVFSPQPNEEVSFPLTITGEARGNWFFEAEINLILLDKDGNEIASGFAISQDEDWMTMDFVAFEGEITEIPEGASGGTLVVEENNPASPEEREREVWRFEVPVVF